MDPGSVLVVGKVRSKITSQPEVVPRQLFLMLVSHEPIIQHNA